MFDLLVRNVDRLPCRKTLSRATGNAGNIMFSDQIKEAGQLWAIDNDIRLTESVDSEKIQINTSQQEIELRENKESYVVNFKSVVSEILEKKQERYIFRQINHLIFDEIPEFFGILPASLNTIWSLSCNETDSVFQYCKDKYPCVETAIDTLLQMIRHRYQADPFNLVYEKLSVPSLLPTNRNHTQAVFLRGCEWSKHPGDDVVAGEVIVTIKIDEVVNPIEIRALKAGKIVKTLATAKNQVSI